MDINAHIGLRIKAIRMGENPMHKKYTQTQLCVLLNLQSGFEDFSEKRIQRLEKGTCLSLPVLMQLADFYGISIDEFFDF